MTVELFGNGDERVREALKVRFRVFVDEQNVPREIELDEHDEPADRTAVHALVRDGERAVAAGRFYERNRSTVQIGRMAVVDAARGHGIGRLMLDALLVEAAKRGYVRARLSAQTHALEFYRKAGFAEFGEDYDDAGIPHRDMERPL
ncbi:MAG: GNAT family N-acetyltransferase [Candidatus Eremiobacteraeota bacterium]|nr:GNAT family N-acetyltransferase [Candidatus Eremiobacteraeota bacterium]